MLSLVTGISSLLSGRHLLMSDGIEPIGVTKIKVEGPVIIAGGGKWRVYFVFFPLSMNVPIKSKGVN